MLLLLLLLLCMLGMLLLMQLLVLLHMLLLEYLLHVLIPPSTLCFATLPQPIISSRFNKQMPVHKLPRR